MHANERVLIVGELGLAALGLTALLVGQTDLAAVAVGAFAGLLAGHLNGRQA